MTKVSSSLLKVCLSVLCLSLGFTLSVQICLSEFPLEWVSVLAIVREYVWVSVGAYAYFQIEVGTCELRACANVHLEVHKFV